MIAIARFLIFVLDVYMWIIIAEVVISWLIVFDVINIRNPKAQNLLNIIAKLTRPVMEPIRKVIPPIAGLDLSPVIAIFGIMLLQQVIYGIVYG
jgi:YggT family protein